MMAENFSCIVLIEKLWIYASVWILADEAGGWVGGGAAHLGQALVRHGVEPLDHVVRVSEVETCGLGEKSRSPSEAASPVT